MEGRCSQQHATVALAAQYLNVRQYSISRSIIQTVCILQYEKSYILVYDLIV